MHSSIDIGELITDVPIFLLLYRNTSSKVDICNNFKIFDKSDTVQGAVSVRVALSKFIFPN